MSVFERILKFIADARKLQSLMRQCALLQYLPDPKTRTGRLMPTLYQIQSCTSLLLLVFLTHTAHAMECFPLADAKMPKLLAPVDESDSSQFDPDYDYYYTIVGNDNFVVYGG